MKNKICIRIREDCEFEEFYKITSFIEHEIGASLIQEINDFDSMFWVYEIDDVKFVLHYNVYDGITLCLEEPYRDVNCRVVQDVGERILKGL